MSLARYRLLQQLSAGSDAIRYVADDTTTPGFSSAEQGGHVLVLRLLPARVSAARWARLSQQVALVARIHHQSLVPVHALDLESSEPFLVLERAAGTLADDLAAPTGKSRFGGSDRVTAMAVVASLAQALVETHRMGIAHGRLDPQTVLLRADGCPMMDLTGVDADGYVPSPDYVPAAEARAPRPSTDVHSLGRLLALLLEGTAEQPTMARDDAGTSQLPRNPLSALIVEMTHELPEDRPSTAEVLARLQAELSDDQASVPAAATDALARGDATIGPYRLQSLLGEGGMGQVYRAEHVSGGDPVALKLLHEACAARRDTLRRFYREARLLANLHNPYIARFIEANEDRGTHYLAMEFVEGETLADLLGRAGRLPSSEALRITADVARALAEVHDLGIVHRDVKPSNILLERRAELPDAPAGDTPAAPRAKLCDFGVAREVEAGEADVTRAGVIVGTPHFMSPEQCAAARTGPPSDVYSLGVTLYRMLTGRVPFDDPDVGTIALMHLRDPVPDIRKLCPALDPRLARVLDRALDKDARKRHQNARELLEDLERVRHGEALDIGLHPRLPEHAPAKVVRYDVQLRLVSPPEALWPYVSNTDRLNRAIGLDAIEFSRRPDGPDVETRGSLKLSGISLGWREHPFEWVAPERLGVLREFTGGPFAWLRSTVQMRPAGSGTELSHTLEIEPRGMVGRAAAALEFGRKMRKNLERVYARIDAHVAGRQGAELDARTPSGGSGGITAMLRAPGPVRAASDDAFEDAPVLHDAQCRRLDQAERALRSAGADDGAVDALVGLLRSGSAQQVARIRPRALAREHGLDERAVVEACLLGAEHGALVLLWDLVCPRCQVAADIQDTLRNIRNHAHCPTCNRGFELDFGASVEIVFRAHPQVRDSELGTYCIGGPAHTPHVLCQLRLGPRERFAVDLRLPPGVYRLTVRQLSLTWRVVVEPNAPLAQWELSLAGAWTPGAQQTLASGSQRLLLTNDSDGDALIRIEEPGARDDALTASEVCCVPMFREMFPDQLLEPGELVSVSQVTLLAATLPGARAAAGDERQAFRRLTSLHRAVQDRAGIGGGAVVKMIEDGVLAAFPLPGAAVQAGLELARAGLPGDGAPVRVTVVSGPALATTINDRLDYFGSVVRELYGLVRADGRAGLVVSEALCTDPEVDALLSGAGLPAAPLVVGGAVASWRGLERAGVAERTVVLSPAGQV